LTRLIEYAHNALQVLIRFKGYNDAARTFIASLELNSGTKMM